MKEILKGKEAETETETEIIKKFEEIFHRHVIVIDFLQPKQNLPKEDDIMLLYYKDHYNVIKTYQQCIINIMKCKNSKYCFIH